MSTATKKRERVVSISNPGTTGYADSRPIPSAANPPIPIQMAILPSEMAFQRLVDKCYRGLAPRLVDSYNDWLRELQKFIASLECPSCHRTGRIKLCDFGNKVSCSACRNEFPFVSILQHQANPPGFIS